MQARYYLGVAFSDRLISMLLHIMHEVVVVVALQIEKEKEKQEIAKALGKGLGVRKIEIHEALEDGIYTVGLVLRMVNSRKFSRICEGLERLGFKVTFWLVGKHGHKSVALWLWIKRRE